MHFTEVLHALAGKVAGAEVPHEEERRLQSALAGALPKVRALSQPKK